MTATPVRDMTLPASLIAPLPTRKPTCEAPEPEANPDEASAPERTFIHTITRNGLSDVAVNAAMERIETHGWSWSDYGDLHTAPGYRRYGRVIDLTYLSGLRGDTTYLTVVIRYGANRCLFPAAGS